MEYRIRMVLERTGKDFALLDNKLLFSATVLDEDDGIEKAAKMLFEAAANEAFDKMTNFGEGIAERVKLGPIKDRVTVWRED